MRISDWSSDVCSSDLCATGVAFTRNPSTGENAFYGEYPVNSQGEDVVAGIRTPQHLTVAGKKANGSDLPALEEVMPEVFNPLVEVRARRSEEHTSELPSLMRSSYAHFCFKKKNTHLTITH